MDGNTMSPADIAALQGNDMNGNSWIWFLLVFVLLGWNGNGGNRQPVATQQYVTSSEFQQGMNYQSLQNELSQLGIAVNDNNSRTLQAVNDQTLALTQMNGQNNINMMNGFNTIGSKLDALGDQMRSCCCEIKTMMLQNRLDEAERKNVVLEGQIANNNQTQAILNALGRFVAYAGSGSASAAGN
jgi:hypothetical protein